MVLSVTPLCLDNFYYVIHERTPIASSKKAQQARRARTPHGVPYRHVHAMQSLHGA